MIENGTSSATCGRRTSLLRRAPSHDRSEGEAGIEITAAKIPELSRGDRGLLPEELAALERQGFVLIPSLIDAAELAELRTEYERLVALGPPKGEEEPGARRGLADMDSVFGICWRHRVVLEAAAHVLGERFQASGVELRDPVPGYGGQPLHADTPLGLNATWFLDAFTADNGATRLLPQTHKPGVVPAGAGRIDPGPDEVTATGPAGSVLLRHTALFHAGGHNSTDDWRRSAWTWFVHDFNRAEPGAATDTDADASSRTPG